MSDTSRPRVLPRKILGMNSPLSASGKTKRSFNNFNIGNEYSSQMDSMRYANINKEMHSMWSYRPVVTPVCTTPFLMTPNIAYAAVPLYQTVGNGALTSSGIGNQQQNPNRESNNMMIQIGLQCVNQNNLVNINSLNEMTSSLSKQNLNIDQTNAAKKEEPWSLCNSPTSSSSKDNGTDYIPSDFSNSFSNVESGESSSSNVVLSQAKFEELKSIALRGSEIAEKLAYTHRSRPCFKKIDSLCARMKQDITRTDGVMANINSQGIAWAVKDFIFVFTRVINAWIIIKGYVYNTHEGLNKVRSALSPDFDRSFAVWQDSTTDFVDNLMKSFVNLDKLVQEQKNVYHKINSTTPMNIGDLSPDYLNSSTESATSKDTTINNNYVSTMVVDGDVKQHQYSVNEPYMKTGTYQFPKRKSPDENDNDENLSKPMSNIDFNPTLMGLVDTQLIQVLEDKLSKYSSAYDPNLPKPLGKDVIDKLNAFMNSLMKLKTASVFFKTEFCKNYFPDFISKTPEFVDLRKSIIKCQIGGYCHIYELVHDIKSVIYQGWAYLKKYPNQELENAIASFDDDVNKILAGEPYEHYKFDHIKGKPGEVLYKGGK